MGAGWSTPRTNAGPHSSPREARHPDDGSDESRGVGARPRLRIRLLYCSASDQRSDGFADPAACASRAELIRVRALPGSLRLAVGRVRRAPQAWRVVHPPASVERLRRSLARSGPFCRDKTKPAPTLKVRLIDLLVG